MLDIQVMRQRNRVADTLSDAIAVLQDALTLLG